MTLTLEGHLAALSVRGLVAVQSWLCLWGPISLAGCLPRVACGWEEKAQHTAWVGLECAGLRGTLTKLLLSWGPDLAQTPWPTSSLESTPRWQGPCRVGPRAYGRAGFSWPADRG